MTPKEQAINMMEEITNQLFPVDAVIDRQLVKNICMAQIDAVIKEVEEILFMAPVHGLGRNRIPLQNRISDLVEIRYEIDKL